MVLDAIPTRDVQMIEVLGVATLSRFDLCQQMLDSIDYPIRDLVIVNNSGTQSWQPRKPELVERMWHIEVPYGLGLVGAWNLIIKATPYAKRWMMMNDDAWFYPGALEIIDREADPEALNFVNVPPTPWAAPIFGERVIREAGLYDEAFYPVYYDDNDFERRIINAGIPIKHINVDLGHNYNATMRENQERCNITWVTNRERLEKKIADNDFSVHGWSLDVRRENRWD